MQNQLWVELVGDIITVRTRGKLTEEVIRERHARILQVAKDTGCKSVLFDALETDAPSLDAGDVQRSLNLELKALDLRLAIVVPNSRLAYLARLFFGDTDHRVFYNDMKPAILWLSNE